MNNLRMILEEILPFYFFIMIFPIIGGYQPTRFELYIVYAFAFGVAVFNNRLYKQNENLRHWGNEVVSIANIIEKENAYLRNKMKEVVDLVNKDKRCLDEVDSEKAKEKAKKE